jgi:ribosome-associated protein
MLQINDQIAIPDDEFSWSFVRAGGPGGQNVNKVASKAVLRWGLEASPSLPDAVKVRLKTLQRRRITVEGEMVITGQRYRDQEKNRQDCLEKLRNWILEATFVPRPRKATKPSRASKARRVDDKRRRSTTKATRRTPSDE